MSVTLAPQPVALERRGGEGATARRAIARWSWRLFRREWRQQILVLALMTLAVAATTTGVALASSATQPQDGMFGAANSLMTFPGSDRADIASARQAFAPAEVIAHRSIPVPGSLDHVDLRAEDPLGRYGHSTLRLVAGHFPTGATEIATTRATAATLGVRVGSRLAIDGTGRTIVGMIENPLDLRDEFALVAPGQAGPPDEVTLLFDASPSQVDAFPAAGHATGIGTRGALNKTDAAAVVLALETIGLLFVGLVAAAGFAVMAQRRLRALGMLGALGATDRHVRFALVANGAAVGLVGSVVGAVIGLATWIALAPHLNRVTGRRIDPLHAPWWAIGAAMLLAVVTAIAAAWWPARAASRAPIVVALSGRPAPPKPARGFAALGGALLLAGLIALGNAEGASHNAFYVIGGTAGTTFGILLLGPLFIRALAAASRNAPIALRLAVRDLARYQARSAAALGAITLALAIAATIAVSAAAVTLPSADTNLAANELLVAPVASGNGVLVDGSIALPITSAADLQTMRQRVAAIAATLHARSVIPLTQAIDPASGTFSTAPPVTGGGGGSFAIRRKVGAAPSANAVAAVVPAALGRIHVVTKGAQRGVEVTERVPLYVATPAVLRHYGIAAGSIKSSTDILTSRDALSGLVVHVPRGGPTPCDRSEPNCRVNGKKPTAAAALKLPKEWHPTLQTTSRLPTHTSDPNALLTPNALRRFGLRTVAAGWLIESPAPLTADQVHAARQTAAAAGISIESGKSQVSYTRLRDGATGVGILVALGILAMTIGLIRSETANDLRTLSATGAGSTARRLLTGATAGALALLGAVLGTAGAYLALLAWNRHDLHPLTRVPYGDLVVIVIGLPLIAVAGGLLLAGREPPAIARRPIE